MKKRFFFTLFFVLSLLTFIPTQKIQAKPNIPLTLSTAKAVWAGVDSNWTGGITFGAMEVMIIQSPSTANAGDYYHKRMLLTNNDTLNAGTIEFGFQKVHPGTTDPVCGQTWSSPYLSWYYIVTSEVGTESHHNCGAISNCEVGASGGGSRFRAWTVANNVWEAMFQYTNSHCSIDTFQTALFSSNTVDPDYDNIGYYETYNGTTSGHYLWGFRTTQNNWMDSTRAWKYENVPGGNSHLGCSGSFTQGCPSLGGLMWYWEDGKYPADSGSAGGTMDQCGYSSYGGYPQCTIGS